MDYLKEILTGGVGSVGLLIVVLILNKAGILDKLIKRNGNGKIDEATMNATIQKIENNHFLGVNERLTEICEKLDKINDVAQKTLTILEIKK